LAPGSWKYLVLGAGGPGLWMGRRLPLGSGSRAARAVSSASRAAMASALRGGKAKVVWRRREAVRSRDGILMMGEV
jgi:hypothetical protein